MLLIFVILFSMMISGCIVYERSNLNMYAKFASPEINIICKESVDCYQLLCWRKSISMSNHIRNYAVDGSLYDGVLWVPTSDDEINNTELYKAVKRLIALKCKAMEFAITDEHINSLMLLLIHDDNSFELDNDPLLNFLSYIIVHGTIANPITETALPIMFSLSLWRPIDGEDKVNALWANIEVLTAILDDVQLAKDIIASYDKNGSVSNDIMSRIPFNAFSLLKF